MTWWLPHNFEKVKPYLEIRMNLIRVMRDIFNNKGFWEVETPILQVSPVMDAHIHAFKTKVLDADLKHERDMYLHTSPEFAMKKLLVAGLPKIYQISHVFRNAENSSLHSSEFTLIEWYRANADYRDIMDDCVELLRICAERLGIKEYKYKEHYSNPFLKWNFITVSEAFDKYAEIDLEKYLPVPPSSFEGEGQGKENAINVKDCTNVFRAEIISKDIRVTENDKWDDLFFAVMSEKIEPHLGMGVPTILYDYPASMASLSRKKHEDPRFAERFELYVCGIELANAFSELTNAKEQRLRFEEEMILKQELYSESYPIDEDFLKALEHGLPESGGIALGVDRLVMLATGAKNINQVLWTGKL